MRARAVPWDRSGEALLFTVAAVVIGAFAIRSAYRFEHFTHQWANTAVIWVAALCALAGARRALAVAVLRPTLETLSVAGVTAVVLAITGSAAVWQTDQSTTVPVYTEESPATYGDSVYLFLKGDSQGAVSRVEAHGVVELEFGKRAIPDSGEVPTGRCWEVLTTTNTVAAAETWPWQDRLRSPGRVQRISTVEVKEVGGDWTEVNWRITDLQYCLTDLEQVMFSSEETELGSQTRHRIVVSTASGPPVALRLTDSKGVAAVINLQDPGTECATYEHLSGWEKPDDEQPCDRIHDLEDQYNFNAGEAITQE